MRTTPTERGFERTLGEVDRTIDGVITIAQLSQDGLALLCQLRDWAQHTERKVETALAAHEDAER